MPQIPLLNRPSPLYRSRQGHVYANGVTIPVTIERVVGGIRVSYRGGVLGRRLLYLSKCLEGRDSLVEKLANKESVRL